MPKRLADTVATPGLTVLERGWLSSNNVLLHDAHHDPRDDASGDISGDASGDAQHVTQHSAVSGDAQHVTQHSAVSSDAQHVTRHGAVLVDSGHCLHAAQTVALVRQALKANGQHLAELVNTHLHSDHCGGNAALQQAFGMPVAVPQRSWAAVQAWDEAALSFHSTGQQMQRFTAQRGLTPGGTLVVGGRSWDCLAAPGHDADSLVLFDARHGVLISADALWENGFGVVFEELAGQPAFDAVAATLDLIESLPVASVIPGHGAPFSDVAAAMARARSRLAAFVANPLRHARHGIKVLLKYHLMEVRQEPRAAFDAWAARTPLLEATWQHHGQGAAPSALVWCQALLGELVTAGVVGEQDGVVFDR